MSGAGHPGGTPPRQRPRIGMLLDRLSYMYQNELLQGAHEELARCDADLCCFSGGPLAEGDRGGRSSLYELASRESLDGLIVASSTVANLIGSAGIQAYLGRFETLPISSIGVELCNIPSLLVDNFTGVRDLATHLIEIHGRTTIAVVTGPPNSSEAQQRLAGYRAALEARGLPVSEALIIDGDFSRRSGVEAVRRLYARGAGCDAIMCSNDDAALGVLEALDQRGIRVPRDVAVTGFDDVDAARFTVPSLTTIRQPTRELGVQAARSVLAQFGGEQVPLSLTLPTSLRLRHSCGCFDGAVSGRRVPEGPHRQGLADLQSDRQELSHLLVGAMPADEVAGNGLERADRLISALCRDLTEGTDYRFISQLDEVLESTVARGNVHGWHRTLSFLRTEVGSYLRPQLREGARDGDVWEGASWDGIVEQAHITVSAAAERGQGRRRLEQENLLRTLQQTTAALLAAVDVASLASALAESLPKMGVPSCTVALQPGGRLSAEAPASVVVAYDGRLLIEQPREVRGESLLLFDEMPMRRRSVVLQPLFVGNDVLGYCALEMGSLDGMVYEVLCEQIGAAVKGVQLFRAVVEEITKREHAERARLEDEMQAATRIQTGILPKVTSAPGLEISATMLPATEVGGDYFDVLPFAGGCWLGIGDVAGHGLPTGVVMLMIQSIVAATTRCLNEASASSVWVAVNNLLYDNLKRLQQDEYATLSLIRYESSGRFQVAGAHEELIIYRRASGRCETVPLTGTWAGIMFHRGNAPPESCGMLNPGDVLLLYTDGVTESMNEAQEQFGVERLCAEVESVGERPVIEIRDHLVAAVRAWSTEQATEQVDDITIVVLRQREG